jgi:hypothetical protein
MSQKFRTFASNKTTKHLKIMRRISSMGNHYRIETFDLSEEQHDLVVEMVRNNPFDLMQYELKKVEDREMVNVWIADAHSEGDEEYAEFLREALAVDAEIFTFKDEWQEIGEVAIYDC